MCFVTLAIVVGWVLDCGVFSGDAGCAGDFLAANSICDSEMTAYTTCVAGGGT